METQDSCRKAKTLDITMHNGKLYWLTAIRNLEAKNAEPLIACSINLGKS
jgi:hypothetical protein